MFSFVFGVVIGAAFAPVWMKLWAMLKETDMFKKIAAMLTSFTDVTK